MHVAGIAGVGMRALAELLVAQGWRVTGSDRFLDQGRNLPVFDCLRAQGVTLFPQDGTALTPETRALVYSTAVEKENADMQAAHRLGIPLKHRAKVLAELATASGAPLLAVAGTSGKTTITGMLGHALTVLGADPTVVNGGALVEWAQDEHRTGFIRVGRPGAPWVMEADESDRSFLRFHPAWSIISNLSQDHFSLAETIALFRAYAEQIREGLVCGPGVAELLGHDALAHLQVVLPEGVTQEGDAASCRLLWRNVEIHMKQGGTHTGCNALLAAELCFRLGYAPDAIARALSSFRGIQRRMECVGESAGIRVYDDYGHNPAKISAAWQTAASGGRRVLGVWRPHGFGPLRQGMDVLAEAFAGLLGTQNELWLLPVFDAGGTATRDVSSADLAAKIMARNPRRVHLANDFAQLEAGLCAEAKSGDVILIMGARDPELPLAARRIAARLP